MCDHQLHISWPRCQATSIATATILCLFKILKACVQAQGKQFEQLI